MPLLGIERHDFDYRVYVLCCKPKCPRTAGWCHYVGFEHRDEIKKRITDPFGGGNWDDEDARAVARQPLTLPRDLSAKTT